MQTCAHCKESGTEIFSRCGHILHEVCRKNLVDESKNECPKCSIDISKRVEIEKFLFKIKSFYSDSCEADELCLCALNFCSKKYEDPLFSICNRRAPNGYIKTLSYDGNILEKLLIIGWDINDRSFGGPRLFFDACSKDDLEKVNLLVKYGLNVGEYGAEGFHFACSNASYEVFDRLLQLGAKLDDPKIIFEIISRRKTRMLEKVLKTGLDINITTDFLMKWPIHAAAEVGSIRMVQILVENGADFRAVDLDDNSILHYACAYQEDTELLQYLIDSGFDFTIMNTKGMTPLAAAIEEENQSAALCLIRNKVSLTLYDSDFSVLHTCACQGKYKLIEALIHEGVDVNLKTNTGKTPLHVIAASKNDKEYNINDLVTLLLDNGADINALDKDGKPPLYYLHHKINNELKRRFINSGANLSITYYGNATIIDMMIKEI